MRSKRQAIYDRLYYRFELDLTDIFQRVKALAPAGDYEGREEFERYFRKVIRPYWKRFGVRVQRYWFRHYFQATGKLDARFIPHNLHHRHIIPYFDDPAFERQLEDKNLYSILFSGVKQPETVFRHFAPNAFSRGPGCFCGGDYAPITRGDAMGRLTAGGRFIIKPTRDTGEGMDIRAFSAEDGEEAVTALLDRYAKVDYIVQRVVRQHPDLMALNPSSLNTIRLMTLVFRGEVRILAGIIRIGKPGNVMDNVASGGCEVGIDLATGTLKKKGFTYADGLGALTAPNGQVLEGFPLPCWDKLRETALKSALGLPHLRLIGWDLAVDENGEVVLIEINCHFSQTQESNGPTFGEQTDEILAAVYGTGEGGA